MHKSIALVQTTPVVKTDTETHNANCSFAIPLQGKTEQPVAMDQNYVLCAAVDSDSRYSDHKGSLGASFQDCSFSSRPSPLMHKLHHLLSIPSRVDSCERGCTPCLVTHYRGYSGKMSVVCKTFTSRIKCPKYRSAVCILSSGSIETAITMFKTM